MSANSENMLVHSTVEFHDTLLGWLEFWEDSIREQRPADSGSGLQVAFPTGELAERLPTMDPLYKELARKFLHVEDEQLKETLKKKLRQLVARCAGSSGGVLRKLSDLAFQYSSHRALLSEDDRFDVSPFSVMVATGLSHYMGAIHRAGRHPGEPIRLEYVNLALELIIEAGFPLRAGDLWFADFAARTARLAERVFRKKSKRSETGLFTSAARFASLSLIHKLLDLPDCEPKFAQQCDYKRWPGMNCFVQDSGCASLRTLVVGQLAFNVTNDKAALSKAGLVRFFEALLNLDQPAASVRSRILIAMLLWEILDLEPTALTNLSGDSKFGKTIRGSIRDVEEVRVARRDDDSSPERQRLQEICDCLATYSAYQEIVSFSQMPLQALPG